jgi:hypothetical protein
MKQAWIDANVALVDVLSGGTGTVTAGMISDLYSGKQPPALPMPFLLEVLGDGEKITAETALRGWDQYIPEEWDGRLIPGQFRGISGMLLPDGVKLGVSFPAGGHYGQGSDRYEGTMEL